MVTTRGGPSSLLRSASLPDPIVNSPAGTTTISGHVSKSFKQSLGIRHRLVGGEPENHSATPSSHRPQLDIGGTTTAGSAGFADGGTDAFGGAVTATRCCFSSSTRKRANPA